MEFLTDPDGATPLSADAKRGLIPSFIHDQSQLNDLENKNIKLAISWATAHKRQNLLTYGMILKIHEKMFDQVWIWAGKPRSSEKNLGVSPYQIPSQLKQLLHNVSYWIENRIYPPDEIAIRFHVDLVRIHVFENGNGRHARLMADLILFNFDQPFLSWGSADLINQSESRKKYIACLQIADNEKDYQPIIAFCKS